MITVKKDEHSDMVASAEATLMVKACVALDGLRAGKDIQEVAQQLCVAHAALETLEHYDTGTFNPEEYFNVVSPDGISGVYSDVNTINK